MPSGGNLSSQMPLDFPNGRSKACTSCGQAKLKCNARELFPTPCSRCKIQILECKMDSTFKGMPARRQLEEVSTRLNDLQRSLGFDQPATLPEPAWNIKETSADPSTDGVHWRPGPNQSLGTAFVRQSSNSLSLAEERTSCRSWSTPDNQREDGSWPIDDMILHSDTILALFEHFDKNLYPHLTILEPCTSSYTLYQSSSTLF